MSEKEKNKKVINLLGYKFFRYPNDESDEYEIVRIVKTYETGRVMIEDKDKNRMKTTPEEMQKEGWQPLDAPGVITASIVDVNGQKDVIVTFTKRIHLLTMSRLPLVICRQSVTDIFYSMLTESENNPYVGVSISTDTCPANVNYENFLACSEIEFSQIIHTYLDDTLEDLLNILNLAKFDAVLYDLFKAHVDHKDPLLIVRSADDGWCRDLRTLLTTNNFWIDVDQQLGISTVQFDLDEHIIEKVAPSGMKCLSLDLPCTQFFSRTYKLNITETLIIEYGYDINLGDYSNNNYMLVKSAKTNKLYLMVYLLDGAYIETDLEEIEERKHIGDTLRLEIYNKYQNEQSKM